MASTDEKVKRIFERFDVNKDGGLNRQEMSSLVVAVNPKVKFSEDQINVVLDEVFRIYSKFIDETKGLTVEGLLRTYDDGAGDVERDFEALDELDVVVVTSKVSLSPTGDDLVAEPIMNQRWVGSPKHGIVFNETEKIVGDLKILIKLLEAKDGGSPDYSSKKRVSFDKLGHDYTSFLRDLEILRSRVNGNRSIEEAFDAHMAMGMVLYEHHLYEEALVSFKKAREVQPTDLRPHFRSGNCLYVLGKYAEAKEEFSLAIRVAEGGRNQWSYLLPQVHVNLGITLEAEGMLLNACEHYKEVVVLCPTHFRALKLLGSALLGVGEYNAAEKALEKAIFLKPGYADAHCDLGSVFHATGEKKKAMQEFLRAIDLNPEHVDALYNMGKLHMDMGRYSRASEMYARVLAVSSNHWRAQLNRAVALLGAGESEEARKALEEASKMTNRVDLNDAITCLKQIRKKKTKGDEEAVFLVVELPKFKRVDSETTLRQDLTSALEMRVFQRLTRLNHCGVELLKKEMNETEVPMSYSDFGILEKCMSKVAIERSLRRLLHFLKPDVFQGAMEAINKRILTVLDPWSSGTVDIGMFYALLAPLCSGSAEKRKEMVFDALLWRPANENGGQIRRADVERYIKLLRTIYIPSLVVNEFIDVIGEADGSKVSFAEFLEMFDDPDWGFRVMDTLVKLETGDTTHHDNHACSVCRYPINGSRFKEVNCRFSLCNQCYSHGKVPPTFIRDEYIFKEYDSEAKAIKGKCILKYLP